MRLRAGGRVKVKQYGEIVKTLDAGGALEGVPFMEEMREFCGKVYQVYKVPDTICVEGPEFLDTRRVEGVVLLDGIRCDGSAHDGCQRLCMIFWKEAWLEPSTAELEPPVNWSARRVAESAGAVEAEKVYQCQSTSLPSITRHVGAWDHRQYVRLLATRSIGIFDLGKVFFFLLYNKIARLTGRHDFGELIGDQKVTPVVQLDLKPGEEVRVKSREEIVETLDGRGRNRGLLMSYEMLRHSGKALLVLRRIDRMILEHNGKMRAIRNTVLLRGTECSGLCVRGCARASFPMWREAWLKRLEG